MNKRNMFSIDFEVCCGKCGEPLEVSETNLNIGVEPCQKCIEIAVDEAERKLL